jgi:NAD(P)-dependent dehydrogenase (short-subunit alcohol dehydrogenase family)
MIENSSGTGTILITGGTSGLGKELVIKFLKMGFLVVAAGRQSLKIPGFEERFELIQTDFSDLRQTRTIFSRLCATHRFDLVINNAGILSPPRFTTTADGLEYTFQVNFLSHLLINEIILKNHKTSDPLIIASVTSPVYRLVRQNLSFQNDEKSYGSFKAYSESKLYLALMGKYLTAEYPDIKLTCISFDPGVFSSGIFRMKAPVFKFLYKVASPFMRRPVKVAEVLAGLIMSNDLHNGRIYDIKKRIRYLNETDSLSEDRFWGDCSRFLAKYQNT